MVVPKEGMTVLKDVSEAVAPEMLPKESHLECAREEQSTPLPHVHTDRGIPKPKDWNIPLLLCILMGGP